MEQVLEKLMLELFEGKTVNWCLNNIGILIDQTESTLTKEAEKKNHVVRVSLEDHKRSLIRHGVSEEDVATIQTPQHAVFVALKNTLEKVPAVHRDTIITRKNINVNLG